MDIQSKAKKLIEMIQTASVEWKPLGEVVPISRGKRLVRSQLQDNGQYPVYQNSLQPLGFYDDQNCRAHMTFVIAAGAAGEIGFSDIEFWAADDCYYFDCPKEILHDKFLYYFLLSERHQLTSQIRKASVPRLGRVSIEKIKIPIPPLETQQKVVKILDKFTELEATLEATLEAELALRKRQYQYYRDFLLDFDNQIGGWIADGYKGRLKDVVWKTLGEVAKIQRGASPRPISNYIIQNGDGIPWIKIGDTSLNSKYIEKTEQKISYEGALKSRILEEGDFVISNSMSYGRPYILKIKGAIHDGWASISGFKKELNPDFLYHYLSSNDVQHYWKSKINSSSVSNLNVDIIKTLIIPIPPLAEQEKIVAILDKFDTLTHSISEGLPHEIALRRKQYEYYREQLLAFPKAA